MQSMQGGHALVKTLKEHVDEIERYIGNIEQTKPVHSLSKVPHQRDVCVSCIEYMAKA